ncbi:hypothetical protein [[Acholeplasma] multilocale]|uniref:hypothetical protein n=1 Tax=[Acholeplasma] multilocale TaxID=264638 RepID=UPI000479AC8A|nr:hypothetical protein [[Acholeplasma] multilocale]
MFLAWDITGKLAPSNIWGIVIFLIALIALLISFAMLVIYKHIIRHAMEGYRSIDIIARNSLQSRLNRLSNINRNNINPALKNALDVWKVNYFVEMERNVPKQIEVIKQVFANKKNRKPTFSNLLKVKRASEDLKMTISSFYDAIAETDAFMEMEAIHKDAKILLRQEFNKIQREMSGMLENPRLKFDQQEIRKRNNDIEKMHRLFDKNVIKGDFSASMQIVNALFKYLKGFAGFLDFIYRADDYLNVVAVEKLEGLKAHFLEINLTDEERLNKIQKYEMLKEHYEKYRDQIVLNISNFKYSTAVEYLADLEMVITNFEVDVKYENEIKKFMTNNLDDLANLFSRLQIDYRAVGDVINFTSELGQDVQRARIIHEQMSSKVMTLNAQFKELYTSIKKTNERGGKLDIYKIKDLLNNYLNYLIEYYEELRRITKTLRTKKNVMENIDSKISDIRNAVSTSEAILIKNQRIPDLYKFKTRINEIYKVINRASEDDLYRQKMVMPENYTSALEILDSYLVKALKIKDEIFDALLLEVLTQKAIVYLERYSTNDSKVEQSLIDILQIYESKNVKEALSKTTSILKEIKNNYQ